MKVIFDDNIEIVEKAVLQANNLLTSPEFFEEISKNDSFDFSTATPAQIAEIMKNSKLEFTVEMFYPNILQAFVYRKTLAFTDSHYPNYLFLNYKKLNREVEDIAATIIHESVHALDDAEKDFTFGHGNNSSVGKENSAPYWIGNLAYRMLKGTKDAPLLAFHEEEDLGIA